MTDFDIDAYHRAAQTGPCFVCQMIAGAPGYEHHIVYDDGDHVAFLDKHPTLYGKLLVTPRAHVEDTIGGFTEEGYLAFQRVVHQVASALSRVVETERMYVMSLGSQQGNSHVHWHIAPLPPGVPYAEQQFYALDWSTRGRLQLDEQEAGRLAALLRGELDVSTNAPAPTVEAMGTGLGKERTVSDWHDMQSAALTVRRLYDDLNQRSLGRTWDLADFVLGFVGDVGDLAKLVMARQGRRTDVEVDQERIAHELSDGLFSLIVIAQETGISLGERFTTDMAALAAHIRDKINTEGGGPPHRPAHDSALLPGSVEGSA